MAKLDRTVASEEIDRIVAAFQPWHASSRDDLANHLQQGYQGASHVFLSELQANFPRILESADPEHSFWSWLERQHQRYAGWLDHLNQLPNR